ncbi:MAG: DUF488 family protein, N3 subclade [Candidatus Bathycorpusculaceae bacterium]
MASHHPPQDSSDKFKEKYKEELKNKKELLRKVKQIEKEKGIVTLLYAAKDKEHNNAIILSNALENA